MLQIYTDSAEAKIPAVLDYLGTVIEVLHPMLIYLSLLFFLKCFCFLNIRVVCIFYIMVLAGRLQVSSICTPSIHDWFNLSVSSGKATFIHTLLEDWSILIRTSKFPEEKSGLHSNWWKYPYSVQANLCYRISRKRFCQGSSGIAFCFIYINCFLCNLTEFCWKLDCKTKQKRK